MDCKRVRRGFSVSRVNLVRSLGGRGVSRVLDVEQMRIRLAEGNYFLSEHALSRVVERNINAQMIRQAGSNAEVIEDYPTDKYSPSCLLLGFTQQGTPLHLHVSKMENARLKIITLYVPDARQWLNFRVRKDIQ